MKKELLLVFVLVLLGCFSPYVNEHNTNGSSTEATATFGEEAKKYSFEKGGKLNLWSTYYYVPTLVNADNGLALLDKNEEPTGFHLNICEWCKAAIEGTVAIKKNEEIYVLNYAGRSKNLQNDCRNCEKYQSYDGYEKTGKVLWAPTEAQFGLGVKGYHLIPYKTIAVDPNVIPYGSVIYVPEAEGVAYKNSNGEITKHNGLFFAGDTGSKIIGNHIDVFIGYDTTHSFSFITSKASDVFTAFLVKNTDIISSLEKQHRK